MSKDLISPHMHVDTLSSVVHVYSANLIVSIGRSYTMSELHHSVQGGKYSIILAYLAEVELIFSQTKSAFRSCIVLFNKNTFVSAYSNKSLG